jgi:hypothetical protein
LIAISFPYLCPSLNCTLVTPLEVETVLLSSSIGLASFAAAAAAVSPAAADSDVPEGATSGLICQPIDYLISSSEESDSKMME